VPEVTPEEPLAGIILGFTFLKEKRKPEKVLKKMLEASLLTKTCLSSNILAIPNPIE
jgi:hypothetical protein